MSKSTITLHTGEVLVGEILEESNPMVLEMKKQDVFKMTDSKTAIWIKRERHITFLDTSEIESIRPANIFDKEIKPNHQ